MLKTSNGDKWEVDPSGDIEINGGLVETGTILTRDDLILMLANIDGERRMVDKRHLSDDLTKSFIEYQHRLDHPMPHPNETFNVMELRYHNDPMFRARVMSLVGGVMHMICKHIDKMES